MKVKIKKIIFGYLPGFLTGLIICGTISVIAATYFPSNDVTYDNSESGLSSTNVQGAIDELYGVCTADPPAGETIIENAGLEKDPYECRYFFTGANPNNYITFNNEKAGWRIISVECDGTIKIMRVNSIGNQAWNTIGRVLNNWALPAELNTYLNGTYYNGLDTTAQRQVVSKDFSIGVVSVDETSTDLNYTITTENSKKWNGKVALATVSEYLRSNSRKSSCGTLILNNDNYSSCRNTTWMYINDDWWTLSPYSGNEFASFHVNLNGTVYFNIDVGSSLAVRPALYLSSEIKLSGSGTQSNPYIIE